MSVRQYAFVVELADAGSFRRAAENLNVTHTALVHSIKATEEHYGARLFDRGRGVKAKPTRLGEIFIRRARQILQVERDLVDDLRRGLDPGAGLLSVAMGPFPHDICGREAFGRMISRYPDLQIVNLIRQFKEAMQLIRERKVNLAIAETSSMTDIPDLVVEHLERHVVGFFCRPDHPLLSRKDPGLEDLVEFPWCCTRLPARVRSLLPADLRRAGHVDPATQEIVPTVEVDSLSGMHALISASDTLGPCNLITLKDELESGELRLVPFHRAWMKTNYGIISLRNRSLPPAAVEFVKEIHDVEMTQCVVEQELIEKHFPAANTGT